MSDETDINPPPDSWTNPPPRRSFLTKAAAMVIGAFIGLVPAVAGLLTVLDPVRRRKEGGGTLVPVTALGALPADGKPRLRVIRADLVDAWTKTPDARIGAVFLARRGDRVTCLSAICPHAGCFVAQASDGSFKCPCHESEFETDGAIRPLNARGQRTVSPRGLDSLDVEIKDGQVYVRYERFRAGTPKKIPQT